MMKGWLLEVETPSGNWCQDIIKAFPDHEVSVNLIAPTSRERCIEAVTIAGPAPDAVIEALERHPHVVSATVTGRDGTTIQLRLMLRGCPVANVARETGLAPRLPFVVVPGKDIWMVVGQKAALRAAQDELARREVGTQLVGKGSWAGISLLMTDHQQHVLRRAIELGYYEYPRKISLTDFAERLGVAKSTLSQALIIIEMKLAFEFMERPARVLGTGAGHGPSAMPEAGA